MSDIKTLRKQVTAMLGDIRKSSEPAVPPFGLILYEPIEEVQRREVRLSQVEYCNRILAEQPAVRARFEELRNKGCHVWVWLPDNERDPDEVSVAS